MASIRERFNASVARGRYNAYVSKMGGVPVQVVPTITPISPVQEALPPSPPKTMGTLVPIHTGWPGGLPYNPGPSGGPTFGGPVAIPGSGGPTSGVGGVANAACNLLPAHLQAVCRAGATLLPGGGGGGGGGTTGGGFTPSPQCPQGKVRVGNYCVSPGDAWPGGAPFITGAGGVPVAGAFGIPGYQPLMVNQPIRRCPPGFALAKDGVCYVRSLIPRKFRAHPPGKKPPLTGADAAALRRIGSLQTRVKRLAKVAGLGTMTPRKRSTRKRK